MSRRWQPEVYCEVMRAPLENPHLAPVRVTVADDGYAVCVELLKSGKPADMVRFDAVDLDELIAMLGVSRAVMKEPMAAEPISYRCVRGCPDLPWRIDLPPHPSLQGLMLRLRHGYFGWLTFLLPHREAAALADWIVRNARDE